MDIDIELIGYIVSLVIMAGTSVYKISQYQGSLEDKIEASTKESDRKLTSLKYDIDRSLDKAEHLSEMTSLELNGKIERCLHRQERIFSAIEKINVKIEKLEEAGKK